MERLEIDTHGEWAEGSLLGHYLEDHPAQVRERAVELLGRLDVAERKRIARLIPPMVESSFSNAFELAGAGLNDTDDRVRLAFAEQVGFFARDTYNVYDVTVLLRTVGDTPNLRSPRNPLIAGLKSVHKAAGPEFLAAVLERGSRPPRYHQNSTASKKDRKRDRVIQAAFVEASRHLHHLAYPED